MRRAGLARLLIVTKTREASGLRRVYRRFQVRHGSRGLTRIESVSLIFGIEIGSPRRTFVVKMRQCESSPLIMEASASALR
jgi:hypothetical protein